VFTSDTRGVDRAAESNSFTVHRRAEGTLGSGPVILLIEIPMVSSKFSTKRSSQLHRRILMVYRLPHRWLRWPAGTTEHQIAYGADYNPEQWPRQTWAEDVHLMREAGVNIVSVAIFSWGRIQPTASTWDFGWLDEVMDLLHENSIAVDLATATASPPVAHLSAPRDPSGQPAG
jgi:hypothetical protein